MILTDLTTAITAVKTDIVAMMVIVAPVAIAIVGIFLVWKYAVRFFKSLSK